MKKKEEALPTNHVGMIAMILQVYWEKNRMK